MTPPSNAISCGTIRICKHLLIYKFSTYSCDNVGLGQKTTVDAGGSSVGSCSNNLSTGNICVCGVAQESVNESSLVHDIGRANGAVQDVVGEEVGNCGWVGGSHAACGRIGKCK